MGIYVNVYICVNRLDKITLKFFALHCECVAANILQCNGILYDYRENEMRRRRSRGTIIKP